MRQAATLIGQALGKKGLPEAQARALLAAARHVLGGLMAIAPHAKPPLRVEKLAMGLLQKHLDAQQFADAAPHVDALLAHLGTVHSAPDAKARKAMLKTLAKYSAYEWHGTGGCQSCCLVFLRAHYLFIRGGRCYLHRFWCRFCCRCSLVARRHGKYAKTPVCFNEWKEWI